MLSRVADSIYWMNRYIERADNYARFIDANLNLTLDLPPGMQEQWGPLISTTGDNDLFHKLYGEAAGGETASGAADGVSAPTASTASAPAARDDVIRFLLADERNLSSIGSCLSRARENARSIREMISLEIWEHLNDFHMQVRDAIRRDMGDVLRDPLPLCTLIRQQTQLYHGLYDTTLSHSEGWHFGMLGRQLERADQTTRLLDVKYFILLPRVEDVGRSFDLLQWSSVLKSASAYEMYNREFDRVDPRSIIRFLVLDRYFPRAIRFCLKLAETSLREITGSEMSSFTNRSEKLLGRLRSQLDYTEVEDIFHQGLHEYLDVMQLRLNEIGQGLGEFYFRIEE